MRQIKKKDSLYGYDIFKNALRTSSSLGAQQMTNQKFLFKLGFIHLSKTTQTLLQKNYHKFVTPKLHYAAD